MKIFCYCIHDNGFWFRLFGYGLCVIDRTKQSPTFSVRNGYRKEYNVGKYGIKILKRGYPKWGGSEYY